MRTIILALLCACSGVTTLRYRPSKDPIALAGLEHGRTTLSRPPIGEARAATLADGFPVWIVHHDDGTVSVVSAVAPPPPRRQGFIGDDIAAQVGRAVVSWIPGVRKFYAAGILFDEHGQVLGYADSDGCAGACPTIASLPLVLRDLDSFTVTATPASTLVEVGSFNGGRARQRAATFLPWRRTAEREQDMHAAFSPAMSRLAMVDALAIADGHYAIVEGTTVRSTHAVPAICEPDKRPGTCGQCTGDRLPLAGIVASDAAHLHRDGWWKDPADYSRSRSATYVEAEPGTFVVRRQGASFHLVAGVFRGICSGTW